MRLGSINSLKRSGSPQESSGQQPSSLSLDELNEVIQAQKEAGLERASNICRQRMHLAKIQYYHVDIPRINLDLMVDKTKPVHNMSKALKSYIPSLSERPYNGSGPLGHYSPSGRIWRTPAEFIPVSHDSNSDDNLTKVLANVLDNFEYPPDQSFYLNQPAEAGYELEHQPINIPKDKAVDRFLESSNYSHYSPGLLSDYMMFLTCVLELAPKTASHRDYDRFCSEGGNALLDRCLVSGVDDETKQRFSETLESFWLVPHQQRLRDYANATDCSHTVQRLDSLPPIELHAHPRAYRQAWQQAEDSRQASFSLLKEIGNQAVEERDQSYAQVEQDHRGNLRDIYASATH